MSGQSSCDVVLNEILSMVEAVDFSQDVGKNIKLSNPNYHVICIKKLFTLLPDGYGLAYDNQPLVFNGHYWQPIDKKQMESFLFKCALKMGVPWLIQSHYKQRDALLRQFMCVAPSLKPTDETVINLQNGTLVFSPKPVMKDFCKSDSLRYQLSFSYDEDATAPLFERYLDRCLPDRSAQKLLAEYLGYLFIKRETLNLEKTLLLYGSGANGKSVMFDIVNALLGRENVTNYSLDSLCDDRGYHRAKVENVLLNFCTEMSGNHIQGSYFKAMVSGEPVEARLPYQEPFVIEQYAKMMFNANELPSTTDMSNGFFRRFLIIPFDVTIPESERDAALSQKIIRNELSGVLNWVIAGLNRLLVNEQFTTCEAATEAVERYKEESNSVISYLNDASIVSGHVAMKGSALYTQYKGFCTDIGRPAKGRSKFFACLDQLGYERIIKHKQLHFGIDKEVDTLSPVGFDPDELPYH